MKKNPDLTFCRNENLELLSRISGRMSAVRSRMDPEEFREILGMLGGENGLQLIFFQMTDLSAEEDFRYYEWHHDRRSDAQGNIRPLLKKLQEVLFVVQKKQETIFIDRRSPPGSFGSLGTDLLKTTGLQSILIQPIFSGDGLGGLLGLGSRQSRSVPGNTESHYLQIVGNLLLSVCSRNSAKEKRNDFPKNCAILKQVFDHLPDCLFVKDLEGRFILANSAQIHLIGKQTMEELMGKTDFDLYPRDLAQRFRDDEESVMKTGRPILDREEPGMDQDGNPICISTTKVPLQDGVGRVLGLLGVSRNITKRKKIQAENTDMRRMESMGVIVGGISNDLNNLLTAIMGSISLAKIYLPTEDPAFQRLSQAQEACNHGKEISNRLFHFAKGMEPVKQVLRLEHLLRKETFFSLTAIAATEHAVQCDFKMGESLFPIAVDERQFAQVINHLIWNAVEAMPQGGVLAVRAENVAADKSGNREEESISRLLSGDAVVFSIEDQGVGISEENLPKIFNPYFTTKEAPGEERGRGLGLAVCHSIVKKHGGVLHIESQTGAGTKAFVYLPAAFSQRKPASTMEVPANQKRTRILIMDDEIFVRTVAAEMLTHLGYEVEYTRDGKEAVDLYRTAMETGNGFSLVILDLFVTGGTGGEEAMQQLLDIDPNIKGIVSTGFWDDPVSKHFRHYGFRDFIQKPFSMEQLSEVILRVLKE